MEWKDIAAVVTCGDSAATLGRCLASLERAGELVVVDSFSTDESRDIARRHGAVVYLRPYRSAADQKNWALERVSKEWVLVLDSDEEVTPELAAEIEELSPGPHLEGYWIRRSNFYLGRPIRFCGWQRDKVLRLFRTSRGRYQRRSVHEEVEVSGPALYLRARLRHRPYRSLRQHLEKIEAYSSRGAEDYLRAGGRAALVNMLLHPPFRFFRMYLLQLGFLDGPKGLLLCLLSSYGVFLKYRKAWRLGKRRV